MRLVIFTVIFLLTILSCARPQSTATEVPLTKPVQKETKADWEVGWQSTLQAARKEGKVTMYSSTGGEVPRIVTRAFQDKFGIELEWLTMPAGQVATRILQEHKAGIYLIDLISGGTSSWFPSLKPEGYLVPMEPALILPEVKDQKVWWSGGIYFVDRARTIVALSAYNVPPIGYNTKLVKPEELRSFGDLLQPKWKGKIVLGDPTVAGTPSNLFGVIIESKLGIDYWRQMVKQDPIVLRDQRLQVEWLAQGKYPVTLVPKPDIYEEFKRAGAALEIKNSEDGVYYLHAGAGHMAWIRNSPHPNAAKVFINWLLDREGGLVFQKATGRPSARLDVPKDDVNPLTLLPPGVKEIITITEEFQLREPEYKNMAKEIFGNLIR